MANAVRRDVELIFGRENVLKWADLDNDRDTFKAEERIVDALSNALDYIYSRIRRRYDVPFTTTPRLIKWLNALYAGILLFDSRLIVAQPGLDQLGKHRKEFRRVLREILSGQLHLAAALDGDEIVLRGIDYPFVAVASATECDNCENVCCDPCCECNQAPCVCSNYMKNWTKV